MNTEYTIIPICIPDNDSDFIKVSNIPVNIYERDDETGRLIDSLKAESEAIKTAARVYRWTGKLDYVYGFSTAGGIGDKKLADKSNKRIIEKVSRFTRIDLMREGW